jgi:hypothetical protein
MWFVFAGVVAAAEPPPTLPTCAVVRPLFTIDGRNVAAGTMFATKIDDTLVLVTAHQLFGPVAGLPSQIAAGDLPAHVTALSARDALTNAVCGRSQRTLVIADAAPMDKTQSERDVAAFVPAEVAGFDSISLGAGTGFAALPLATNAPSEGDQVWLAASVQGRTGLLHPATIVAVDQGALYYTFDDPKIDLTATNGAPVVDAAGAVVGMALGSGTMPDGLLVGNANGAESLKKRISTALAAKP